MPLSREKYIFRDALMLKVLLSLLPIASLSACASNIPLAQCAPANPNSIYSNNDYVAQVYGGNDGHKPDIWEGPICITRISTSSSCSVDVSLIKAVELKPEGHILEVLTFSGSSANKVNIDMNDCSIK